MRCGHPTFSDYNAFQAFATVMWRGGFMQERCPHCRLFLDWKPGVHPGLWALDVMSGGKWYAPTKEALHQARKWYWATEGREITTDLLSRLQTPLVQPRWGDG